MNRGKNGIADPLSYAPRWVRQSQPIAPERPNSTQASSTAPVITTRGDASDYQRTPDGAWDRKL